MSLAEASERKALEALKKALGDNPRSPSHPPGWDGNTDFFTIGVVRLAAAGEITDEQARRVLGPELGWAMLCRFKDLAAEFLQATGDHAQNVWEQFRDISEWLAAHHSENPTRPA